MAVLQFAQFASAVDAAFWQALATKKLDVLKLSEAPQDIHAYYTTGRPLASDSDEQQAVVVPARFCVPAQGLDNDDTRQPFTFPVSGTLVNTNTLEDFKNIDKNDLFQRLTIKIWEAIRTREALKCPSILSEFLMLTFGDLKNYKFYYWFAFPAMMPQGHPWVLEEPLQPIATEFSKDEIAALAEAYQEHRYPYFLIKRSGKDIRIGAIEQFEQFFDADQEPVVGFADPSSQSSLPGWPLRNFLALLHECFGIRKVKVVCYREMPGRITSVEASRILVAELPSSSSYAQEQPKAVGWERNAQGKLSPRMADLGPIMDPLRLADTAVYLNLKLMRWRIVPDLDLDKIKNTKCLLLGVGTLGCYVARSLLGWGVRNITFVDNGQVSHSNPVRQPLYTSNDYGAPKAKKAAESILQIQPTANASGYDLSIPMPGHIASSDDQLRKDVDMLFNLIQAHDAIFLLTDSRESRWLPTLLGTHANKIVINAALGFDTYLVMRHGSQNASLGCYFCNDVVAPTDSLKDRTLDQQCTVTRPGLAAIAGALAVELFVSLLQHKDGVDAAADTATSDQGSCVLGLVPHQIRGFLGQFRNLLIVGQQFENCTACSKKVLEAYRNEPFEFIKKVLRDPAYLEQVSGIAQMKADSEALLDEIDWVGQDDDEDNLL